MSSECHYLCRYDVPITALHSILKRHAIIYNPPYDIKEILSKHYCSNGLRFRITIEHSTRNVNIVGNSPSIDAHVISVAVNAFQSHRLARTPRRAPRYTPRQSPRQSPRPEPPEPQAPEPQAPQATRTPVATCSICFESIYVSELRVLQCAHLFHEHCIGRWAMETSLAPTCPECRTPLA